ncbi:MAG: sulfotransferase [Pseudomonadota bacterium]
MIGRKPDLVCIGAQKAATSWLYRVCQARSDIWVPPFKEVHFFDHKFCPENRNWIRAGLVRGVDASIRRHTRNQPEPDPEYLAYLDRLVTQPTHNGTWYKAVFSRAPARQLCLDVTPEYSTLPEEGVAFVANFLREARFIYILRDPVDRALSQLRMNLSRRKITPSSVSAWMRHAKDPAILNRGDYQTYIPRWDAQFDDRRLLYLPYGQISRDPEGIMRQIERFVGLEREDPWGLRRKVHVSEKMEVPETVRAYLGEALAPQYAFLEARFDRAFAARLGPESS